MRVLLPLRKAPVKEQQEDEDRVSLVNPTLSNRTTTTNRLEEAVPGNSLGPAQKTTVVSADTKEESPFEDERIVQNLKEEQAGDDSTLSIAEDPAFLVSSSTTGPIEHRRQGGDRSSLNQNKSTKRGSFKTTGLAPFDNATSEENQNRSHSSFSRKRRAASNLDEQHRKASASFQAKRPVAFSTASSLDQNPTGRALTRSTAAAAAAAAASSLLSQDVSGLRSSSIMVSGGGSRQNSKNNECANNSNSHWHYYHHADDDVRQDSEDLLGESPDITVAENDPASARGDTIGRDGGRYVDGDSLSTTAVGMSYPPVVATARTTAGISAASVPVQSIGTDPTIASSKTRDGDFEAALKKRGLEIRHQEGDGNCLFRAISLQVYGDPGMHEEVRKRCMDFMVCYELRKRFRDWCWSILSSHAVFRLWLQFFEFGD
jgi:hypothetical protein